MPFLEFHLGDRVLFRHLLRPGRILIGRSDRCDIALPSDDVSRFHCALEFRDDAWWLSDRSRNGTLLNGLRVRRAKVAVGDWMQVGDYVARFTPVDAADTARTRTNACMAALHEELVDAAALDVAVRRLTLEITRGGDVGARHTLRQARVVVGGPGADIELGSELPRHALQIRAVRGRALVEPGEHPTYLDGVRIRELTPVYPGEELRVGPHGFTLREHTEAPGGTERERFGDMVGRSPAMRRVFTALERMAAHDAPVLVCGESGTGKELAARALHDAGPRHQGPFVAVNCAAIASTLFESELFGHEKGAFTGAVSRQEGAFQRADGGTLFLDEVGELSLDAQAKLLRALESGEVTRVGGSAPEYPDARVVTATNRNLPAMVQEGTFRQDLYFRLAVLTLELPALRDRADDVPLLADALLRRHHPEATLTEAARRALSDWRWPGNVRELRNVLTRAYVLGGPRITASALSFQSLAFDVGASSGTAPRGTEQAEREMIERALAESGGNRTQAARKLGMPRSSLLYRMKRLGIG